VSHNAPLSEFDAVAERYLVFRIDPTWPSAPKDLNPHSMTRLLVQNADFVN
jgi:hypothetical protein